jgi:hypothetical protein
VTALAQNPNADEAFAAWLAACEALNPGHTSGPVIIPGASPVILPDETFRALAERSLRLEVHAGRYSAEPDADFLSWASRANVLQPLRTISIDGCRLTTGEGQTLQSFAALYDFSVGQLGGLAADVPGLLDVSAAIPVAQPPVLSVEQLVQRLNTTDHLLNISGQVSHFMMHGQRLPNPEDTPAGSGYTPLKGMYELVGQQVTGPDSDPSLEPNSVRATLCVERSREAGWLSFVQTEALAGVGADGLADLNERWSGIAERNPALAAEAARFPGVLLETAGIDALSIPITEAMLRAGYPEDSFVPDVLDGPKPMPLRECAPERQTFAASIPWRTSGEELLLSPGGTSTQESGGTATPSLWPLPDSLKNIAVRGVDVPWHLYLAGLSGNAVQPQPFEEFAWASMVKIGLNRVPGRPDIAEVTGADTAGRLLLFALREHLKNTDGGASLYFAFSPSPDASLAEGLQSRPVSGERSFIVRGNLSTETHSGLNNRNLSRRTGGGGDGYLHPYFASTDNALGFVNLLWEASVTASGGYWLTLAGAGSDDAGLFDESIWGSEGQGSLTLIVVLESQRGLVRQRRLYPFNNVALLTKGVDLSVFSLFAASSDSAFSREHAVLPPGYTGFTMSMSVPPENPPADRGVIDDLYTLLTYRLEENSSFIASNESRPVGATKDRGNLAEGSSERNMDEFVTLSQSIPIFRFAKRHTTPDVPGLPAASACPDTGMTEPVGKQRAVASVVCAFSDIFGNTTA